MFVGDLNAREAEIMSGWGRRRGIVGWRSEVEDGALEKSEREAPETGGRRK